MKAFKLLPLFILLIITSCASVNVNTDYDKSTNFSDYKTYAYYKQGIDNVKISDFDKFGLILWSFIPGSILLSLISPVLFWMLGLIWRVPSEGGSRGVEI